MAKHALDQRVVMKKEGDLVELDFTIVLKALCLH